MTANSRAAHTTPPARPSRPERPRRLRWTLIALLWVASFCVSIYASWIPGPAERRLFGYWMIGDPDRDAFGTLMQLRQDRRWSIWGRNPEFRDWQYSASGRWSLNGDTIELRFATGRSLQDFIESLVGGDQEQLIILECSSDRMLTRSPDVTHTQAWTRVPEDAIPHIQTRASGRP